MTFNGFFPIFLTFGAIQGIVLALLFSLRTKNKRSGRILAVFLLAYALPTLNFALLNSSLGTQLPSRVFLQPFILLLGPSFYFFVRVNHNDIDQLRSYILHALPFFAFSLLEVILIGGWFQYPLDYHGISVISSLLYSYLTFNYYRNRSKVPLVRFGYIQVMIYCFGIYVLFWISFIVLVLFEVANRLQYVYFFGTAMALVIYSMGFIAYWKSTSPPKNLDEELSAPIIERIRLGLDQLISDKFYLQSNIPLQHIANSLNTSPRYISRFINDEMNTSYPNFVNKLRVGEAKRIIQESSDNPKMLAVALDSGFSNKVTFNIYFKKHTGLTPKQFKDQCEP